MTAIDKKVLDFLARFPGPRAVTDIAAATGQSCGGVVDALHRLLNEGRVMRMGAGVFRGVKEQANADHGD